MTRWPLLAFGMLLAGCSKESRRQSALARQAIRERLTAVRIKVDPEGWKADRRKTELAARTPAIFIYHGDTVAVRDVSAAHKKLILGRIDVRGVKQPDGSCNQDSRDQPWVNPTYGLFVEVGQLNLRTCAIQLWVIDPHLPEYGPMTADTTVFVAPR